MQPIPTRSARSFALLLFALLCAPNASAVDTDGDFVDDAFDNCSTVPNNQADRDLDGWGDACDFAVVPFAEVGLTEFGLVREFLGCTHTQPCWNSVASEVDYNHDGVISIAEFAIVRGNFGSVNPPSGLACVGSPPCTIEAPRFDESPSSTELNELATVQVLDFNFDGVLNQLDVDTALGLCGASCNLLFLADVYEDITTEINGFTAGSLRIFGYRDDDADDETVLRAPIYGSGLAAWTRTLWIREAPGEGIIVQGLTIEGRKGEQVPPADCCGVSVINNAAAIDTFGNLPQSNVVIRRNEIRNNVITGIGVARLANSLVDENYVHGIGCNQLSEPCGEIAYPVGAGANLASNVCEGAADNPWDCLAHDDVSNPPGSKRSGLGIVAHLGSDDVVISHNTVEDVTKIAIEVYGPPCLGPESSGDGTSRRIVIDSNNVSNANFGITINGGCEHTISGNFVSGMNYPGPRATNAWGNGISNVKGGDTTIEDNIVTSSAKTGYVIGCSTSEIAPNYCDNQIFRNNKSIGNCTDGGIGTADLFVSGSPFLRASGIAIENFDAQSGGSCTEAVAIRRWDDVTLRTVNVGGSPLVPAPFLEGGSSYALYIAEASDVSVDDIVLVATQPGLSTGVRLREFHDAPNGDPAKRLVVEDSITVTNFATTHTILDVSENNCLAYCPVSPRHRLCKPGEVPVDCR